jgi:guanine deaminase
LQAHLMQRVAEDGVMLDAARLLYLSTLAGAQAIGMDEQVGDFRPGKAADFVYLLPPDGSVCSGAIARAQTAPEILASLLTLAGAESVREVRVAGSAVYRSKSPNC